METLIETERLLIRELLPMDDRGMFEMDSDTEVHYYLKQETAKTIEDSQATIEFIRRQYIKNGIGRWAVIEKETNEFVGWLGFKSIETMVNNHINFIDFGYRVQRKHWGKGFATEGSKAALEYGFKHLNYKEVYAMTDVENRASRRVLEKVGFSFVEVFNWKKMETRDWQKNNEPTTWYQFTNPNID